MSKRRVPQRRGKRLGKLEEVAQSFEKQEQGFESPSSSPSFGLFGSNIFSSSSTPDHRAGSPNSSHWPLFLSQSPRPSSVNTLGPPNGFDDIPAFSSSSNSILPRFNPLAMYRIEDNSSRNNRLTPLPPDIEMDSVGNFINIQNTAAATLSAMPPPAIVSSTLEAPSKICERLNKMPPSTFLNELLNQREDAPQVIQPEWSFQVSNPGANWKSKSLSKPLYYPERDVMIVGFDESIEPYTGAANNEGGILQLNGKNTSPQLFAPTHGYVNDLTWVIPGKLFAVASGLGYLQLFEMTSPSKLTEISSIQISSSILRQISMDNVGARLAAGGYEGVVKLFQLSDSRSGFMPIREYQNNRVVGSIQWHPDESNMVSYTTDCGSWNLLDVRHPSPNAQISFPFHLEHKTASNSHSHESGVYGSYDAFPGLLTHSYVSKYQVLLGFGSGKLQLFDIRRNATKTNKLIEWQDNQVNMIGDLVTIPDSSLHGVFGLGGFAVWDIASSDLVSTKCLYRSGARGNKPKKGFDTFKTSGTFTASSDLIVTDSTGTVAYYNLSHKLI